MATARVEFSVDEVEALIPALERIFVQVLQLRAGADLAEVALDFGLERPRHVLEQTERFRLQDRRRRRLRGQRARGALSGVVGCWWAPAAGFPG